MPASAFGGVDLAQLVQPSGMALRSSRTDACVRWFAAAATLVACISPAAQKPSFPFVPRAREPHVEPSLPVVGAPASNLPQPDARPNVVLFTIDSLRADMPWSGYPRSIAPRLTELASRCVTYERAYATASHTAPSVASILFGRYASELERDGYFSSVYPTTLRGFPSLLGDAGIRTVAGHAHEYMRRSGFATGFRSYDIVAGLLPAPNVDPNQTSRRLAALAQNQLDALGALDGPPGEEPSFFAWYHFVDPHAEWLVPPKSENIPSFGPKIRDRYDAEVYLTDKYVGAVLDHVATKPWADRTVVLVTSDHGEAVGDHGQLHHGYEVWESLVRVPLLVCVPGVPPRKIATPRSLIDLGPTILDIFGVAVPPEHRGQSLLSEVRGEEQDPRDVLVDLPANDLSFARRALVREKTKIVYVGESRRRLLYDLENDREERRPIRSGALYDEEVRRLVETEGKLREVKPHTCAKGCAKGWP